MEQLALLRKEMDEIDRELTQVFLRRLDVAAEIGAYKQQIGLPGLDQRRELQVIRNASAQTEDAGRKLELAKLYDEEAAPAFINGILNQIAKENGKLGETEAEKSDDAE